MLTPRGKQIRRDLYQLSKANGGQHYGGTFSTIEILYNLYDRFLTFADRFILSKGHACWGYYVILMEQGKSPALQGHPHMDVANGVDWTTGSEGHGLPAAVGMAFAKKKMKKAGHVFVLMGDGECQEGTTWESFLLAGFHKLNNLTAIVDFNRIQGSGFVDEILPINNLKVVAESCGWRVLEIDGHDDVEIGAALSSDFYVEGEDRYKPLLIIAHTVKGKGVDFMENKPEWHSRAPNATEEAELLKQLA